MPFLLIAHTHMVTNTTHSYTHIGLWYLRFWALWHGDHVLHTGRGRVWGCARVDDLIMHVLVLLPSWCWALSSSSSTTGATRCMRDHNTHTRTHRAVTSYALDKLQAKALQQYQQRPQLLYLETHTHTHIVHPCSHTHIHAYIHRATMAFARSVVRQMGHGLERVDVNLSLRKWWKLGYTRQNGLVSAHV